MQKYIHTFYSENNMVFETVLEALGTQVECTIILSFFTYTQEWFCTQDILCPEEKLIQLFRLCISVNLSLLPVSEHSVIYQV